MELFFWGFLRRGPRSARVVRHRSGRQRITSKAELAAGEGATKELKEETEAEMRKVYSECQKLSTRARGPS